MIIVKRYTDEDRNTWNNFISNSKNGIFMFDRNYMEYHKDRYEDHSLLFYEDHKLISLLPANIKYDELQSHGGLTYGGFITDTHMSQKRMNECFDSLINYSNGNGIHHILYKTIPHIYHRMPAEEDRYSLYLKKFNLYKTEPSTVIDFSYPGKMTKGRKAQISRAKREGVEIKSSVEFEKFIHLENSVLEKYHDRDAVHTGAELSLLHDRFPSQIRLVIAEKDHEMIAGALLFVYETVVHTQYLAAGEEARRIGALDLTIATIINEYKDKKRYLDFGISSENNGRYLNEGLIFQKESFGGRTYVYETYKIDL